MMKLKDLSKKVTERATDIQESSKVNKAISKATDALINDPEKAFDAAKGAFDATSAAIKGIPGGISSVSTAIGGLSLSSIKSFASGIFGRAVSKITSLAFKYFNPAEAVKSLTEAVLREQANQLSIKKRLEALRASLETQAVEAGAKEVQRFSTGLCNRNQDGFVTAVVDGVVDKMDPTNMGQVGVDNQDLKESAQQALDVAANSDANPWADDDTSIWESIQEGEVEKKPSLLARLVDAATTTVLEEGRAAVKTTTDTVTSMFKPSTEEGDNKPPASIKSAIANMAGALVDGNTVAEVTKNSPKEAAEAIEKQTAPITDYLKNITNLSPDAEDGDANKSMFSKIADTTLKGLGTVEKAARDVILSDTSGLLADSSVAKAIDKAGNTMANYIGDEESGVATKALSKLCNIEENVNTSQKAVQKAIDTVATMAASEVGNAKAVEQAAVENKIVFRGGGNCCVNRAAKTIQQTQEKVISVLATAEAVGIDLDEISNTKIKEPFNTNNVAIDNTKKVNINNGEEEEDEFEDIFNLVEFKEIIAKGPIIAKILLGEDRYNKCKAMYDMSKAQENFQQAA